MMTTLDILGSLLTKYPSELEGLGIVIIPLTWFGSSDGFPTAPDDYSIPERTADTARARVVIPFRW